MSLLLNKLCKRCDGRPTKSVGNSLDLDTLMPVSQFYIKLCEICNISWF